MQNKTNGNSSLCYTHQSSLEYIRFVFEPTKLHEQNIYSVYNFQKIHNFLIFLPDIGQTFTSLLLWVVVFC